MADAGVSASVIQTYVESTRTSDPLTPGEIIALKEHKVPDEVVALMVRQNAEARAALVRRAQETAREAALARRQRHGGMDPESYEYFQYYYLQPRATASAYRRGTLYGGPHPHLGPGGWFGGGPRFRPHYLRY